MRTWVRGATFEPLVRRDWLDRALGVVCALSHHMLYGPVCEPCGFDRCIRCRVDVPRRYQDALSGVSETHRTTEGE